MAAAEPAEDSEDSSSDDDDGAYDEDGEEHAAVDVDVDAATSSTAATTTATGGRASNHMAVDDDDDDDASFAGTGSKKRAFSKKTTSTTTSATKGNSGRTAFGATEIEMLEDEFSKNPRPSAQRVGELAERCNQLRAANAPRVTAQSIKTKFSNLRTKQKHQLPVAAPLELTDELVRKVVDAFRERWIDDMRDGGKFTTANYLFRHGATILTALLEQDRPACAMIRPWLESAHAAAVTYFQARKANGTKISRSLHIGTARTRFQVELEVAMYNAAALNLPDDAPVRRFAKVLSDFVQSRNQLSALIGASVADVDDPQSVQNAKVELGRLVPKLDSSLLTRRTALSMYATLKANPTWRSDPADALFLTSITTAAADAAPLREPGMICAVFQHARLLVYNEYAKVLRFHRAKLTPSRGWAATATALLARGSNFEVSADDIGDVHHVAASAIRLFVYGRGVHLIRNTDSRILRALIVSRATASADKDNTNIYVKSFALELHENYLFCSPIAFTKLFLPIAKRFFSFPAVLSVDHYVALVQLVRSETWRCFVSALVAQLYAGLELLNSHANAIFAFVANGICTKFVRILLSIQFKKLEKTMSRAGADAAERIPNWLSRNQCDGRCGSKRVCNVHIIYSIGCRSGERAGDFSQFARLVELGVQSTAIVADSPVHHCHRTIDCIQCHSSTTTAAAVHAEKALELALEQRLRENLRIPLTSQAHLIYNERCIRKQSIDNTHILFARQSRVLEQEPRRLEPFALSVRQSDMRRVLSRF